ncbi:unnamed protein product [Closterium sp. NIES-53]
MACRPIVSLAVALTLLLLLTLSVRSSQQQQEQQQLQQQESQRSGNQHYTDNPYSLNFQPTDGNGGGEGGGGDGGGGDGGGGDGGGGYSGNGGDGGSSGDSGDGSSSSGPSFGPRHHHPGQPKPEEVDDGAWRDEHMYTAEGEFIPHVSAYADEAAITEEGCRAAVNAYVEEQMAQAPPPLNLSAVSQPLIQPLLFFLHIPRTGGRTYHMCFLKPLYPLSLRCPRSYDTLRLDPS